MVHLYSVLFFFCCFLFHPLDAEILQKEGNGYLESRQGQQVLHVKGSPYEMGYQHGKLLKEQIQRNILTYIDNPGQKSSSKVSNFLSSLSKVLSYVPTSFKEEMKGLAEGADVALEKILILNLFPEMFHCTGLTVTDAATVDESLYHVRVLDYAIGKNLQSTAVLIVAKPSFGIPFVNVSYAGFIGSVTGMNAEKIAIGEIGGSGYGYWDGVPMTFLIREILEKATSVEEAKDILSNSSRTCEYYYIISDGKTSESVGVYATASQIQFVEPGTSYAFLAPKNPPQNYGLDGADDKFFLPSIQMESRDYQLVLREQDGKVAALVHKQPQGCLLLTGFCYEDRYPVLVSRILENYGKINVPSLIEIIKRPVARESDLHNAIFHPATAEIWVSHAGENNEPACDEPYVHYSLDQLLGK